MLTRVKIDEIIEQKIEVPKRNLQLEDQIKKNWDACAKPLDGMGMFENLLSRIGAIQGNLMPQLDANVLAVMCADNGVVEEGVSQSDASVTAICARNIAALNSAVGAMAKREQIAVEVFDVGMVSQDIIPNVHNKKIAFGTKNFAKERAMTEEEAMQAIQVGMDFVWEQKAKQVGMILTGEMGIGNTTTSSAIASALLSKEVEECTGRGAGLSDEGLIRKQTIIRNALLRYNEELHEEKENNPSAYAFKLLCCVGGFDIAALCGICFGGACYQVPILLDGMISMIAALVAERICPGVTEYLIPTHKSKEPVVDALCKELKLAPIIDANMALGEGTGAVLMCGLLKTANEVYKNSSSFMEYGLTQYERKR